MMKMFDYFMHLKDKNSESKKLKKDKPFLAVIAFCAVIILIEVLKPPAMLGRIE